MSGFLLDTYPAGTVIKAPCHTFQADGASVTASDFVVGDVDIYKDGSDTQRSSDSGNSVSIDFDSKTGIHYVVIDLSDNADAGFYAIGSQYSVIIGPITVDSKTVNFVFGTFRIVAAEHTAGYPVVTIKDGTGTGEIDTISGGVLVAAVANNAITAAAIANGAIDAATFAADVDAEILSYIVDDATRIDASALNTLSGHDPGETIMGATDLGTGAGLTSLATAAALTTVDGNVDAIKAKTDNLPSDPADASVIAGRFDTLDGAVGDLPTNSELATALAGADDAVLAAIAALNNLSSSQAATAVLTTQMTESYAANGTAPTLAQALLAIHQHLMHFAISGTSRTVKKLNGSDTAFTETLDDDAAPTSLSRA
jgi:hypothetical protein